MRKRLLVVHGFLSDDVRRDLRVVPLHQLMEPQIFPEIRYAPAPLLKIMGIRFGQFPALALGHVVWRRECGRFANLPTMDIVTERYHDLVRIASFCQ